MSFEIQLNGRPFSLWESASVTRSIDSNTGTFSFSNSSRLPAAYPVRAGDAVRVLIHGVPVLTGYVDEVSASGDSGSNTISVSGRDTTADLIDSSLPDGAKSIAGLLTLSDLAEKVASELGAKIGVVDSTGLENFLADAQVDGSTGSTCMDLLTSYARKLQVYIIADGRGRLEIFRPGGKKASSPLLHLINGRQNNVKSWSVKAGYQKRYNRYICRSQDNVGFDPDADYGDNGTARTGDIEDQTIRAGRIIEVQAEESMTDEQCTKRANEEANLRRARSTEYTATVAGTQQANGELWSIGQIVIANDEFAGIRGEYIIRSAKYSIDVGSGSQTTLTLAPVDAYTVQGVENVGNKRKSRSPSQIENQSAPQSARRVR
jgi:prophage tail gpP-like protein